MTTTQIQKPTKGELMRALVSPKAQAAIASVASGILSGETMANVLLYSVQSSDKLQECTLPSLIGACKKLAMMGCAPDNVNGYIVPRCVRQGNEFRWTCIPIPSARGLQRMSRLSGVDNINIGVVRAGDDFRWGVNGGSFKMHHEPADPFNNSGEIRGFYCTWSDKSGNLHGVAMSNAEVMAIRDSSDAWKKAKNPNETPWGKYYEEMAKKTVIKRAAKQWDLPLPAQQAMQLADTLEFDSSGSKLARAAVEIETAGQEVIDCVEQPTLVPANDGEEAPTYPRD